MLVREEGRFPLLSAILDCVTSPSPLTSTRWPLLCPVSGFDINNLSVMECHQLFRHNVTYARPVGQE